MLVHAWTVPCRHAPDRPAHRGDMARPRSAVSRERRPKVVLVSSFGRRWFDTWLPTGFTTQWYGDAWREFGLFHVITVTLIASALVRTAVRSRR